MVHHGKPSTLTDLHVLIQAIYSHYWEHHTKIAHETNNSGSSGNKSKQLKWPSILQAMESIGEIVCESLEDVTKLPEIVIFNDFLPVI